MSHLVGNSEDRFSRDKAYIVLHSENNFTSFQYHCQYFTAKYICIIQCCASDCYDILAVYMQEIFKRDL